VAQGIHSGGHVPYHSSIVLNHCFERGIQNSIITIECSRSPVDTICDILSTSYNSQMASRWLAWRPRSQGFPYPNRNQTFHTHTHPEKLGNVQQAQWIPQERGHQEENGVRRRHLAQQQWALAGRLAGNDLRNPRPAALPDDPTHAIPRLQGNKPGGVRMNPMDRGRVDQWRRGVPGPEDGAAI